LSAVHHSAIDPSESILARVPGISGTVNYNCVMERPTPESKGASPSKSIPAAPAGAVQELANYKQLVARAVDVFGDEIKASKWLSLANPELSGETPLQVSQRNGYNPEVLEPLLTQIEHGIYR
jgi:hypothetical protein